jgi:hypothetical protein
MRLDLVDTVDALRSRVSPDAIKNDVTAYVRKSARETWENAVVSARNNPLQTAALATAIAYPLWRIIARIPVPILLVGAGLALSKSGLEGENNSTSKRVLAGASNSLKETARAVRAGLHDAAGGVQEATRQTAGHAVEGLVGLANQTVSAASSGVETIKRQIGSAHESIADSVGSVSDAASSALASGYRTGADAATRGSEMIVERGQRVQDNLMESIERHPLIVGGIGLAVGALIAASLPKTSVENRWLGRRSDELKDQAGDVASRGLGIAQNSAKEVYRAVTRHAEAEGLTSEALRESVNALGETVKSVVQQAVGSDTKPEVSGT